MLHRIGMDHTSANASIGLLGSAPELIDERLFYVAGVTDHCPAHLIEGGHARQKIIG